VDRFRISVGSRRSRVHFCAAQGGMFVSFAPIQSFGAVDCNERDENIDVGRSAKPIVTFNPSSSKLRIIAELVQ